MTSLPLRILTALQLTMDTPSRSTRMVDCAILFVYLSNRASAYTSKIVFTFLLFLLSCISNQTIASTTVSDKLTQYLDGFEHAGVLLVDPTGRKMISINADQAIVAASTVKLLTALLALENWGPDYRFETRFATKTDASNASGHTLLIEAGGDPFLVSEEMNRLAGALFHRLIKRGAYPLTSMTVDDSLYRRNLKVPGQSGSTNPYDAVPAPWSVNFNSVNLTIENGQLQSGEEQTPLTRQAIVRAVEIGWLDSQTKKPVASQPVAERFSLGGHANGRAARYATEILISLLQQHATTGVKVVSPSVGFSAGSVPDLPAIYVHQNQTSLIELLAGMLKFSTNFTANQLALNLSAANGQTPADFEGFSRAAKMILATLGAGPAEQVVEGAGLSRRNRLSATTLVSIIDALAEWHDVLPSYTYTDFPDSDRFDVRAKTGSLQGVSSLAGTISIEPENSQTHATDQMDLWRFAILLNDPSLRHRKERDEVLRLLLHQVHRVQ